MKIIHNHFQLPNKTKVYDYGEAIVATFIGDIMDCRKFKKHVNTSYLDTIVYRGTEYQVITDTVFFKQIDATDYIVGFMANLIEVYHNEDMDETGSV